MSDFERRVYWDGYGIGPKPSGIAVYASSLGRALKELGVCPRILQWNFWNLKPLHPIRSILAIQKDIMGTQAPKLPVVIHGLSNINIPLYYPNKKIIHSVVTVHDLIPFFAKESVSSAYYQQFSFLLPKAVRKADRVVCVSEWTRRTLLERYPEIEEKTSVILNGSDGLMFTGLSPQHDLSRDTAKPIKILTVGRPEIYKRHRHFIAVLRQAKGLFTGTIVTTKAGFAEFSALASDLIHSGTLKILFDVPNEELQSVYTGHDVYVHPSLFEGFCLPAVEALRAGIPVVFQKGSAVDEVVSPGCGRGLDQQDSVSNWIDAIKDAEKMHETSEFMTALQRHYERMPTWKDAAAEYKKLYTYLLEN